MALAAFARDAKAALRADAAGGRRACPWREDVAAEGKRLKAALAASVAARKEAAALEEMPPMPTMDEVGFAGRPRWQRWGVKALVLAYQFWNSQRQVAGIRREAVKRDAASPPFPTF